MRREDIANFLTAERKVSPLMAFSLLIVAGVMAGSFQLVAPQGGEKIAMTAQAAAPSNSLDSQAPKDCADAITKALGKTQDPQSTTVDRGAGSKDGCFGGVLLDPVKGAPSQNRADYKCVGRVGKVTITADSAITITNPDRAVPAGTCKVQVCQPFSTTDSTGKVTTNQNCGDPKQFLPGQEISNSTGGVPQLPPTGSSVPSGPSALSQTPTPDGSSTGIPAVQPLEDAKPVTTGPSAADQIGKIGTSLPADGSIPQSAGFGATPNSGGAVVPSGQATGLQPFPENGTQAVPGLNAPNSGYDPNAQFQPPAQQQTTFPNGQPLNANTYPTTPPASNGFTDANNPNTWQYGVAPTNTYGQPNVNLPTLEQSTMSAWSRDAMTNPTSFAAISPSQTSWNDVPTSVAPPVQGFGDDLKTSVTCTDAGCTAKPVTPADTAILEKQGFTCTNGSCARTHTQPPPNVDPRTQTPQPGTQTSSYAPPPNPYPQSGSGGSGSNALMSLLSGMMRGFAGALGASQSQSTGPAQTCPTDPQAYAQYQQQYNQQLQQYNYQLQQYNYQMQNSYDSSYYSSYPPPTPPQPCQRGGAGQCPTLPPQPAASTCPNGKWRQMTTAQGAESRTTAVCPVWQCVAASETTPTAQISCSPSVAEKGSTVAISYTCTNSKSSTGYGFTTGGQVSGSTSTVLVDPPENAAGINYAIRCENGSLSAGAQCSVQIAKISISLRAEPQQTPVGKSALIGWVTTGMESCVVSSPGQSDFTDRNANSKKTTGIATTSPITQTTDFYLNCKTVSGSTREEKITVEAYLPGTVSSSVEGRTNVQRGGQATIEWNFPNAPDVSAVALWIYSVEEQKTVALITGHRAKSGTYTWNIPNADDPCNTSSSLVCGSDLIPGRPYEILATLYTPPNAGLGEFGNQNLPTPKFLDNPETRSFKFAQ